MTPDIFTGWADLGMPSILPGIGILRKEVRMQAYCVKCRAKQDMRNAKTIVMKNGRPAVQGECVVCGTKMFRIGLK